LPLAIAAFGALFLVGAFQYVVPQEQSSLYAEFDLDERSFGLLAAGVALGSSLLGLSALWLVRKIGLRRACLTGYPVFALGLAGAALAEGRAQPLAFGLIAALGMAYLHLANGVVVEMTPERPAQATNLLHACNALGKAVGPTLALIGASWRAPFLAVAGAAVVLGAVGFAAPERRRGGPDTGAAPDEGPAGEALRRPLFWACAALFLPIVGMEQTVNFWLPRYLQARAGADAATGQALAHAAASTVLWTMFAVRLLAPLMLRRLSPFALLALSVFGSLGILVGAEVHGWSDLPGMAGLVLCGIAFAVPYPTFFAICCSFFPKHKGLLSVVSGLATSLGFIAFSSVGGLVAWKLGLPWTLRLSPVLALVVLVGCGWVHRQAAPRTTTQVRRG
jgi:fucose permease